jgi:alkylated DNA repair dioxygenase AlkB
VKSEVNLLPRDGVVTYRETFVLQATADEWFQRLAVETPWQADVITMFGKRIVTTRKVAWYGDPGCSYRYSGSTKNPSPWTETLVRIKSAIEEASGTAFNSCLLNYYHHGGEGMGWHSDDEKEMEKDAAIASLSLGAERRFLFKHRDGSGEKVAVQLRSGSLLVMAGVTQSYWLHCLPKTAKVKASRINLTFRRIRPE